MKASFDDYKQVIGIGAGAAQPISGTNFICVALSAAGLQVRFDSTGKWLTLYAGLKIGPVPATDLFKTIAFNNPTAAPITVTFIAGSVEVSLVKPT